MTSDGTNSFSWGAENRMTKITYPGSNNFSTFVYDGLSRNVSIVETTAGSVTSTKQFVWRRNKRCEARDANGVVTAQYFLGGEKLNGVNYYWTTDQLHSVREMTDGSGILQVQYLYDPYGNVSAVGSSASSFQYDGYYRHTRSGLSLAEYRGYLSTIGRWTSRDPIAEADSANLYSFVGNEPMNTIDPSGLSYKDWWDLVGKFCKAEQNADDENKKHKGHNDADDAMRHASWARRSSQDIGPAATAAFGIAKEIDDAIFGEDINEIAMDLNNNREGIDAAIDNRSINPKNLCVCPTKDTFNKYGAGPPKRVPPPRPWYTSVFD